MIINQTKHPISNRSRSTVFLPTRLTSSSGCTKANGPNPSEHTHHMYRAPRRITSGCTQFRRQLAFKSHTRCPWRTFYFRVRFHFALTLHRIKRSCLTPSVRHLRFCQRDRKKDRPEKSHSHRVQCTSCLASRIHRRRDAFQIVSSLRAGRSAFDLRHRQDTCNNLVHRVLTGFWYSLKTVSHSIFLLSSLSLSLVRYV